MAKETIVDTVTATEHSRKICNASQEEPIDDSNFVSYTEKAPSEYGISQKAKVRVDLSSEDPASIKVSKMDLHKSDVDSG